MVSKLSKFESKTDDNNFLIIEIMQFQGADGAVFGIFMRYWTVALNYLTLIIFCRNWKFGSYINSEYNRRNRGTMFHP